MSTGSTRSRRKRAAHRRRDELAPAGTATAEAPAVVEAAGPAEPAESAATGRPDHWLPVSDRAFRLSGLGILLVAAVLRLWDLALKPLHHDEGINGWFVTNLVREGNWAYDPANYHGPTLFYFGLASEIIFGLTEEAMRLVPVLFGIATVALVLALRPFLGRLAALVAAALLAVSPGATYVSRYFIHESLVVFFTLGIVVALLYLLRERRQVFLLLAAASAALLFATKETGIVSVAVMAIAATVGAAYLRFRAPAVDEAVTHRPSRRATRRAAAGQEPPKWRQPVTADGLLGAAIVFALVYGLFFTSFLTNPGGIVDSLATFTIWTQTGSETQVQPLQQYLVWMLQADAPILLFGFISGLIVAWRADSRVAVFVGLWALGITMAYSLVTYKTPWIALNMLVPLAVLAGVGVAFVAGTLRTTAGRAGAAAVLAGALALSTYQTLDLNFVRYDDESYPYVYVHTTRDATALIAETQRIAQVAGSGDQTGIVVVSPEYWPLPWYYRDYDRVGFYGQIVPTEEHMIIARVDQQAELEAAVGDAYRRAEMYNLRPGVDLVLYVRADLADL